MRSTTSCTARGGRTTTRQRRTRAHRWPTIPIRSSRSESRADHRRAGEARGRRSRHVDPVDQVDDAQHDGQRMASLPAVVEVLLHGWHEHGDAAHVGGGRCHPPAPAPRSSCPEPIGRPAESRRDRRRVASPEHRTCRDGGRQPSGIRARRPRRGREAAGGYHVVGAPEHERGDRSEPPSDGHRQDGRCAVANRPRLLRLPRREPREQPQPRRDRTGRYDTCRQPTRRRSAHVRHGEQRRGRAGGQRSRWRLDHRRDRIERAAGTAALRAGRRSASWPDAVGAVGAVGSLGPAPTLLGAVSCECRNQWQPTTARWAAGRGPTRRRPRARRRRARGRSCRGHPACPPRV